MKPKPAPKLITLFCGGLQQGGAERVICNLANYWATQYKVQIVAIRNADSFYPLDNNILHVKLGLDIDASANVWRKLLNNYTIAKTLRKQLKNSQTTHCISFITDVNLLAILACIGLNIKLIVSDRTNPKAEVSFTHPFKLILKKWLYPLADYVVVQTEGASDWYTPWLKPQQLVVINNPLQESFTDIVINNTEKITLIISVGRLATEKNFSLLIKTFANVKQVDWQLAIIGEGNQKTALQKLIENLQVQAQVHLMGSATNIIDWYQRASIFVLSSHFEGYPNVLIEAMAMGLPVISTDCDYGPSEIIKNEVNGLLVPSEDVEAMQTAIQKLIEDQDLRKRLGKEAQKIREKLHITTIAKQWEALM